MKQIDVEGVDTGAFTVEFVLVGVAGGFGVNCDEGALGMMGIP